MRRDERLEVKSLRRLRAPQGLAVNRRGDAGAVAALHRVAQGQRRDRSFMRPQPGEHTVDHRGVEEGPCAVVDEDQIRRNRHQALQAVADRVLPLGSAGDRFQQV